MRVLAEVRVAASAREAGRPGPRLWAVRPGGSGCARQSAAQRILRGVTHRATVAQQMLP